MHGEERKTARRQSGFGESAQTLLETSVNEAIASSSAQTEEQALVSQVRCTSTKLKVVCVIQALSRTPSLCFTCIRRAVDWYASTGTYVFTTNVAPFALKDKWLSLDRSELATASCKATNSLQAPAFSAWGT